MDEGVGHRSSHSLDETYQRKLIALDRSSFLVYIEWISISLVSANDAVSITILTPLLVFDSDQTPSFASGLDYGSMFDSTAINYPIFKDQPWVQTESVLNTSKNFEHHLPVTTAPVCSAPSAG
ncbi:hypothetical protein EVAR_78825_1 [Eumeta japonica]|uniref:Uncharacterized protein n=1 Tax=Eumeta variegata TaxID=151549 RepID=A0A4C1T2I7_EUMVA|nr:hypothetical protein EVAR_78825_1 [Eumeta japonica]